MNQYQSQYGGACCESCAMGGPCGGPGKCGGCGMCRCGCGRRSCQCEYSGLVSTGCMPPTQFGGCGGVASNCYPSPSAFMHQAPPYCGGCGVPVYQGFYHLPWNANVPGCSTYDGGLGTSPFYSERPPFSMAQGGQQSVQFGARRSGGLAGDPSQFGGSCGTRGSCAPVGGCQPRQCSSTTSYTVVPSPQQRALRPRGAPFQTAQQGYAPCATEACTYNLYDPVY